MPDSYPSIFRKESKGVRINQFRKYTEMIPHINGKISDFLNGQYNYDKLIKLYNIGSDIDICVQYTDNKNNATVAAGVVPLLCSACITLLRLLAKVCICVIAGVWV